MFKFSSILQLLFSPDDAPGSGKELTVNETIEFLDKEEEDEPLVLDDKPKKKEEKPEKEDDKETPVEDEEDDEKEDDKTEDDEEEDLEDKEDELDLVVPVRRKEILAKYPTLFKEFPHLERAYYKEQQYSEILPTIDDAKEAVEKATALDNFEKDLLDGNTEKILKAVKEQDQNSFHKIVDNYLNVLGNVDKDAYYHVVGNIIKSTIVSMIQESKRTGEAGEPLKIAAQILNQFVFASSEFEPSKPLAKASDSKDDTLKERERQFIQKQFEQARTEVTTRVDNILKATINANIDPKGSMTDYVKKNASREALESIQSSIKEDPRFKAIVNKLWDSAYNSNFSRQSMDKIKSAYLSRAKTFMPNVIKKARNEALKGMGKRVSEESTSQSGKRPLPAVGRHTSTSAKSEREKAKEIPRGMKSVDYLMQD